MEEREYWPALEYRVSRELAAFAARRKQGLGCDGFIPEDRDETRVWGTVWMLVGGRQERWTFALHTEGVTDWAALLPAENVTGWLSPHPGTRTLVIAPFDAEPDDG
jgi:hypothetical protein